LVENILFLMHISVMTDLRMKLRKVAPAIFEGTPVLCAYLYGSYATGESHRFSDLDVGICVEGLDARACLDLELLLALRIDEKLDHQVQSEVRVINHLPLAVKGRILTHGEIIYSRAEDKRVEFETKTRMLYFDFLPVMRAHRSAYREKLISKCWKSKA
jgi:predicted nucleotidyltransferase